jgi:hypothetical protein
MTSTIEPATDRNNDPTRDPTANVYALVQAESRRQDDLREHEARALRREVESNRRHSAEMRAAESARIDAIRAVDVAAVQRAQEVAAQQASALAAQLIATTDASRVQLERVLEPIRADVIDLRRTQSEGIGQKTQVVEATSRSGSIGLWVGLGVSSVLGFVGIGAAIVANLT